MAGATNTETKKLTYWIDGLPSDNIQKDDSDSLGKLSYWVDGLPYATVYLPEARYKDFAPFFWGI